MLDRGCGHRVNDRQTQGSPTAQHPDGSLAAGIAARLAARLGRRLLTSGSLLAAAGMAALAWTIHEAGAGIHAWQLLAPLAAGGLGMGLLFPPLTEIALARVPVRDAGSASGLLATAQQLGAAAGVAVVG